MLRHKAGVAFLTLSVLLLHASLARAQQSINFQVGVFTPRAEDGRTAGDVLVANSQYLRFGISDFKAMTGGVEWLVPAGDNVEVGVGVGYYVRGVPSVYDAWVRDNGTDIAQEMKLRIIPLVATLKYLPFGARRSIQPYVGVGVAAYFWRYSETGEFVDFNNNNEVFRASYVGTGTSYGPVVTFGVRARVSDKMDLGVEGRWQSGKGNLSRDFLSDRIDLGGINVLGTLRFRF